MKFNIGDKVVYPSHGVGEIISIDVESIASIEIEVYVISFPADNMTIRVPVKRASINGLRSLMSKDNIGGIYKILQGKPGKITNKMWNRRAQEYEAKINSGDVSAVAEVIRDLYRETDGDRSYSERTIYEAALNRLATEISALDGISLDDAVVNLKEVLSKTFISG